MSGVPVDTEGFAKDHQLFCRNESRASCELCGGGGGSSMGVCVCVCDHKY